MKIDNAMELIGLNKINLRDMIYQNCLKKDELEQVKKDDKETIKKMLENK